MKTALVTGASGYLGSHICKYLTKNGWRVIGLDIKHPEQQYWEMFEFCDVRDRQNVDEVFSNYKIDAVFHLAGRIEVGDSVKNPTEFWEVNIAGTCIILNAMKKYGVEYIMYSSTAGVYKPNRINKLFDISIAETEPTTFEYNPYSASKLASENAIKQSGIKHIIFRYFNLAGADPENDIGENHEPETHLIPRIFQNLNSFELYGDDYDTPDGSCIRDYVHVSDVAEAHISGVEYLMNGGESQLLNLGTGKGHSNYEIINLITNELGLPVKYKVKARRQGDPDQLVADITLAQKVLQYHPKHDIISILKTSYDWHKEYD
jgi:UDP-glucose-4-epimerase GalE